MIVPMNYSIAKGAFDILPKDPDPDGKWRSTHLWHYLEETIRQVTQVYGYHEIRTPIFEKTELFIRSVGEATDIVSKEMYSFEDRGGRSLTLRPEATAPVMRAVVEKRLDQQGLPQKLYYIGPMFRAECPQAGRYRQFHQFGIEAIGSSKPEQDVEVIDVLCEVARRLGIKDLTLMLNSVGDPASRESYREALRAFLAPKLDQLSEESRHRFEKNVLRILDSKDPHDHQVLEGAPKLADFLTEEATDHFNQVKKLLKALGIQYEINPKLVRGLDYYNKTVFEVTAGQLGAQNALGGGGRFDGLPAILGGPDLPCVGFAAGLERIIQTMLGQNVPLPEPTHPTLFLIPIGEKAKEFCTTLLFQLRHENIATEIDWDSKKPGKSLEHATKLGSTYALFVGEDELASQTIQLKELATRKEIQLNINDLPKFLGKQ
jgi:histidyl-tRNA synthetase